MKYKRLLILSTVLLFVCVAVICSAMIFRIAYVEVECEQIDGSTENILEFANGELKYLNNKNLLFVRTKDLDKKLTENPYVKIVEIKKSFPNKIYVKISERQETFAVYDGQDYFMLDDEFKILRNSNSLKGNVDGQDNILLSFEQRNEYAMDGLKVGDKLEVFDSEVFTALNEVSVELKNARKYLDEVYISSMKMQATFTFTEGFSVTVSSLNENLSEKFNVVYERYNLPSTDKSVGNLFLVKTVNGFEFKS